MIEILDIAESSRVRIFKLKDDIPLSEQTNCPSCRERLKPICIFNNKNTTKIIRFGLCEGCGYMGYIDRPEENWMVNFYKNDWDKSFRKSKEEVLKGINLPKTGVKASRYLSISLIDKLENINKNKYVCEVGCGYGEILKNFNNLGFNNLIGIENSKYRANIVNSIFGFKTFCGDFNSSKIQNELNKYAPLGIIFSHHVLEHTYHPEEIIKKSSELQNFGDYLILSLPNAEGEHINYGLFYLVHLHSFTKESLEILLNNNNYEIVEDNSPDDTNIVVAAKKVRNPVSKYKKEENYYDIVIKRLNNGLSLNKTSVEEKNVLRWEQKYNLKDYSEILSPKYWWINKVYKLLQSRFLKKFTSHYDMLIRKTNNISYPIQIKFTKDIMFLIK